jgi:vWA-MoxR associated protein C-terminal domain/CHAT domain
MAMGKLVVIKIGEGSFEQGFPVTLEIGEERDRLLSLNGNLPPEPQLPLLYGEWKLEYYEFIYGRQTKRPTLKERQEGKKQKSSPQDFIDGVEKSASELIKTLNNWLNSETFRTIKEKLLKQLQPNDTVQVIIQTEEPILRRLPWCQWDWFEDYTNAEVAISLHNYEKPSQLLKPKPKVRVLAIIGDPKTNTKNSIDLNPDKQFWQNLSNDADTVFLEKPTRQEFNQNLWDEQGWDILFFAGHSSSNPDATTGTMDIKPGEKLTIPDLKLALKKAIERGLQLAIFNSCDGLGIAWDLAELHIPQMIVMREPVPDFVAQEFLRNFIEAFSSGKSLYIAVREAREQLEGLEKEYPCASWLPVICQNPTVKPVTWRGLLLGDIFQDISQSLSPSDWFWFCDLGEDKKINESIQQAYRDSLPVDARLWKLEGNDMTSIIQTLAQYRRLPEFFNRLIQDEGLPPEIRGKLSDLFKIEKQPIAKINKPLESYLIVTVEYYTYPKKVLLNAWLVLDNSVPVKDKSMFIPLIDIDQNQTQPGVVCQFKQMPEQLEKFIEKSRKLLNPKIYNLTIEVFLPTRLMYMDVDSWKIFDPRTNEETILGVKYPIRLRSLERLSPEYLDDALSDWCQQWDRVKNIAPDQQNQELFEHLDQMENFNWRLLRMNLKEKIGLKLTCAPPQTKMEYLFKAILAATTPIAIWTRCHVDHCDLAAEIDRILTLNNLSRLCESVQKVRAEADAQRLDDPTLDHLGFHLSLLWEDPYLIPPYHPTGGGE